MNDELQEVDMDEFNEQYERYSDRKIGYLGEPNAISIQEFATILNSIREWNEYTDTDQITLNVIQHTSLNIKPYLKDSSLPLEKLLSEIVEPEKYYFTFEGNNIKYEENFGRIKEITMDMYKIR